MLEGRFLVRAGKAFIIMLKHMLNTARERAMQSGEKRKTGWVIPTFYQGPALSL